MDQNLDNLALRTVNLWATPIIVTEFNASPETLNSMENAIYDLAVIPSTIKKSNYGGWQSEVDLYSHNAFIPLCQHVSKICYKLFNKDHTRVHQMWACINKKNDQNLIHNHGAQYHVSGVYYVKVPEDSGNIVFRDPRSAATHTSASNLFDKGDCETFIPQQGMLLLFPSFLDHFVLPNNNSLDRISISFDLTLQD